MKTVIKITLCDLMRTVINIIFMWLEDCSDESSEFERSQANETVLMVEWVDG
jgi:hypothetical protein